MISMCEQSGRKIILIALLFAMITLFSPMATGQSTGEESSEDMGILVSFVVLASVCGLVIVWIVTSIWTYKDAKEKGKSGAPWLLISLLLPFIGVLIWIIVRPKVKVPDSSDYYPPPPKEY